jgi:hypothetical protein
MADFAPFIIPEIDAEMKKRKQDGLTKLKGKPFKHGLKEDSCQSALVAGLRGCSGVRFQIKCD